MYAIRSYYVNAACSGFLYGLEQARAIVALHPEAVILLVGVEIVITSYSIHYTKLYE